MKKIMWLTIFGFAMGWWEAVGIVYVREILCAGAIDATKEIAGLMSRPLLVTGQKGFSLLSVEAARIVSPIILLICAAFISEKKAWRRTGVFLWVCGLWVLSYYLGLKILIGWPQNLNTIDCLFLIPKPWFAPVWAPMAVMAGFLVTAGIIFNKVKD